MKTKTINSYLAEGWQLKKTHKSSINYGEKHHILTRFQQKPYPSFCPYSEPGFLSQETVLVVDRKGKVKSEKEIIRWRVEYWPFCYLDSKDKPHSNWIDPNWKNAVQLELLFLS